MHGKNLLIEYIIVFVHQTAMIKDLSSWVFFRERLQVLIQPWQHTGCFFSACMFAKLHKHTNTYTLPAFHQDPLLRIYTTVNVEHVDMFGHLYKDNNLARHSLSLCFIIEKLHPSSRSMSWDKNITIGHSRKMLAFNMVFVLEVIFCSTTLYMLFSTFWQNLQF